jgi:hypothetical protein
MPTDRRTNHSAARACLPIAITRREGVQAVREFSRLQWLRETSNAAPDEELLAENAVYRLLLGRMPARIKLRI